MCSIRLKKIRPQLTESVVFDLRSLESNQTIYVKIESGGQNRTDVIRGMNPMLGPITTPVYSAIEKFLALSLFTSAIRAGTLSNFLMIIHNDSRYFKLSLDTVVLLPLIQMSASSIF